MNFREKEELLESVFAIIKPQLYDEEVLEIIDLLEKRLMEKPRMDELFMEMKLNGKN